MEYFTYINNEQQGPFSADDLIEMRNIGDINDDTPVWFEDAPDWMAYSKLPFAGEEKKAKKKKSASKKNSNKNRYRFGKFYIKCTFLIVILQILAGFAFFVLFFNAAENAKRDAKVKYRFDEKQRLSILVLQEELTNLYPNVINLLISNKKSSQNKFRGFYIPYSLRQHSKAFDSDLTELDGIESSIESAEQMKDNLSRVKNIIRKDLDERLKSIENEIRQYRRDTFRRTSNQRIVDIFSSHVHFYKNPADVTQIINQTIQQWNNRSNDYIYSSATNENKNEIDRICEGEEVDKFNEIINYIREVLLPQDGRDKIYDFNGNTVKQYKSEESQYQAIVNYFTKFMNNFRLTIDRKWYIDYQLEKLHRELKVYYADSKIKTEMLASQLHNIKIILYRQCIFMAFILFMVIISTLCLADFLKAHFDMAENSFKK